MLGSKEEALKTLNLRILELEKRVHNKNKEIGVIKAKSQEEKDQLYAEAKTHERAKIHL